ncbi:type II toxin-antitoxin system HicB family antitoxin [Ferviditalea candida]|uniref:HicB-like antitoxin of toxin-antitoxin system domain-containing protein n=1 Tax=Ferviditalea candida TaxID=3108399 RepID=A0ABU5ZDJ2_9BACL|nr:hypothetical protein [Paenibacillaceae bacterium T2]
MRLEDYLAVPYILEIWSVKRPDGIWVRHAEYPELPGCAVEAISTMEVIEKAEEARIEYIHTRVSRGEQLPVPRPPLRS